MPKKIFELAKELDIGSIELVEKLKNEGLQVRNHMATLTDDEVEKVMALFSPSSKSSGKSGPSKKSASTKKVVKKKVVVKKSESLQEDEVEVVQESAPIEVILEPSLPSEPVETIPLEADENDDLLNKKKTVVRKKADIEEEKEEKRLAKIAAKEASEDSKYEDDRTKLKAGFGLNIVSVPQKKEDLVEIVQEEDSKEQSKVVEDSTKNEKKPHRFTPVYIPPAVKKPEVVDTAVVVPVVETEEERIASKKKAGLAALMGKARVAQKSREISLLRSEEELKSYSALNSIGKPLYANVGRKKQYSGPSAKTQITQLKESKRVVIIHDAVSVLELAKKLKVKFKELRDKVLDINLLVDQEDYLGEKLATQISALYGFRLENMAFREEEVFEANRGSQDDLPSRDPVVTIMGHVDHGKTTLLDYIRNEKVAQGEAGGITQHIGAYSVALSETKRITFLDTPGHAAFGAMRQRGANVTDIVILVVAADDGVMPQTKESIRFCQNANVPIIVAVNKCDKEGINLDRVKQELVEFNLTPEEWGGDTQFFPVSALKGTGIDELLEGVAVLAEVLELKANLHGAAEGVVIESKIEQGRGPVATILVQEGLLNKGDFIVVGETCGRARSLTNYKGEMLKSAGPSTPVQILGLQDAPNPGDMMNVVKNEREAKKIVENRIASRKDIENAPVKQKLSLEDFFAGAQVKDEKKVLNLIVRTDVQGSYEAIKSSLESLANDEVSVKVIGGGVGAINDNDIILASSSNGYIIGFNMRPMTSARRMAEDHGIDIKTYSIIYELINDVKLALEGLLEPEYIEKFIGRAEVRNTFNIPKIGVIAGTSVVDGKIERGCNIRLLRHGKIIHDGKLSSLKRFKDDVKEVSHGYECGMALESFNDIKVDDIFEAYVMVKQDRKLSDIESKTL